MAVSPESPIANTAAIAFVGGGNMARSLIGALTRHGSDPARIAVAEPVDALREQVDRVAARVVALESENRS